MSHVLEKGLVVGKIGAQVVEEGYKLLLGEVSIRNGKQRDKLVLSPLHS